LFLLFIGFFMSFFSIVFVAPKYSDFVVLQFVSAIAYGSSFHSFTHNKLPALSTTITISKRTKKNASKNFAFLFSVAQYVSSHFVSPPSLWSVGSTRARLRT
jgi:hypothetical protein